MKSKIIAIDKAHLEKLIKDEIKFYGNQCNLNHIDVSNITDLSGLFHRSEFNGNIFTWNVANITDMRGMFNASQFNGDISNWDVSNVYNMNSMFNQSKFNGNICDWKPYNVDGLTNMFDDCSAVPPYWSNIENKEQRIKAIDNYALFQNLQEKMSNKPLSTTKSKI